MAWARNWWKACRNRSLFDSEELEQSLRQNDAETPPALDVTVGICPIGQVIHLTVT
jgi:hypothetical protein